jgi:hypothetical protein
VPPGRALRLDQALLPPALQQVPVRQLALVQPLVREPQLVLQQASRLFRQSSQLA